MTDELYVGRLQTRAKHDILSGYLERMAYKVLQSPVGRDGLMFVDGFAGPWHERDEGYRDTSFGIAVARLSAVRERLEQTSYRGRRIGAIFNEANPDSHERLAAYVAQAREDYPQLELHALQGSFVENAPQMAALAGRAFRFAFVDPTGWTGFPIESVRQVVGGKGELLLNFMSLYADRFLTGELEDRQERWLIDLLGASAVNNLRGEDVAPEILRHALRQAVRSELRLRFVCESPIAMEESARPYFWLIYGSRSAAGVEVLRDVENEALRTHEERISLKREGHETDLFGEASRGIHTARRRDAIAAAPDYIEQLLDHRGSVPFNEAYGMIGSLLSIRMTVLKDICVDLAKQGRLEATWKSRGGRKPGKDDQLRRPS
ncbi:MAG: three-Cys-motif partner protein TcmP [Paracoccaceae bacterium]